MSKKYTDPYSGKRKSLRHANQRAHKRRQKALMSATGHGYMVPVGWSDYVLVGGDWHHSLVPAEGAWIVEYQRPRYYKQYRTMCNRRLRKMREVCWSDGAGYRKATEFWWTVE